MGNTKVIQLECFKEMLASVSIPLGVKVRESLVAFLTADSRRVGQAYRDQQSESLARAEAEEKQMQTRAEANQMRLHETQQSVRGMSHGSWLMGVVSLTCFILCFAAEYVFNEAVVPWLVSAS
jgi:hypothetical protein